MEREENVAHFNIIMGAFNLLLERRQPGAHHRTACCGVYISNTYTFTRSCLSFLQIANAASDEAGTSFCFYFRVKQYLH